MRTHGNHPALSSRFCIQRIELPLQFRSELVAGVPAVLVVLKIVQLKSIRDHDKWLSLYRDQKRLVPAEIIRVVDEAEVLQYAECVWSGAHPGRIKTHWSYPSRVADGASIRFVRRSLLIWRAGI